MDLFTFTKEIPNGKFQSLCRKNAVSKLVNRTSENSRLEIMKIILTSLIKREETNKMYSVMAKPQTHVLIDLS